MPRSLRTRDRHPPGPGETLADPAPGLAACTRALRRAFGSDVACAVVAVAGDPALLLPEEEALVKRSVPARRREFAAGRVGARALLAGLGFDLEPLLSGPGRAPLWPSGALGSLAHDGHRCAIAVARAGRLDALGVDIEPDEPLEPELWGELFRPSELERLAEQPRDQRGRLARRLFCAKEAVFKCTRARLGTTLAFREVEILPDPCGPRFRLRLHHPAARALGAVLPVGFLLTSAGSILSGATLAASSFARPRAAPWST